MSDGNLEYVGWGGAREGPPRNALPPWLMGRKDGESMATQSRAGSSRRQAKAAGRAAASRRKVQTAQRASVPETSASTASAGSVAVEPRRQGRPTPPEGEPSRAERKQQRAPATGGRFSGRTEGLRKVIVDTRTELRRVSWPDKETTQNLTLVVIAISVALGILLGGIDFILFQIFEAIT